MCAMGHDFYIFSCLFIFFTLFSGGSCICGKVDPNAACPEGWVSYSEYCYKFVTYPRKNRIDARTHCEGYYATLVRVDNLKQSFFINKLLDSYSVNRSIEWYTSGMMNPRFFGKYMWERQPEVLSSFNNELTPLWQTKPLPKAEEETTYPKDKRYIVYRNNGKNWGFFLTEPNSLRPYICMIEQKVLSEIGTSQRNELYGLKSQLKVPSAPCFIEQPQSQIYFMRELGVNQKLRVAPRQFSVQYSCYASGEPRPTYSWYIVDAADGKMTRTPVDPLDTAYKGRYSITDGTFVINFPISTGIDPTGLKRVQCAAENIYGKIVSNQATLTFGSYSDFSRATRNPKNVPAHRMAIFSCSPPETLKPKSSLVFTFYHQSKGASKKMEPIVDETRPYVFTSQGGALYFSAVTEVDDGDYVCSVSMKDNDAGTNIQSPPMRLNVENAIAQPQMVSIHQDFPKVLPENAFRGDDIRLECFAIGRPAPFVYSWKKVGAEISKRGKLISLNRVLMISNAQIEDDGTYECSVSQSSGDGRDGGSQKKSVVVSLNARPFFTITLTPQYVDRGQDVAFFCEGSGKPKVEYQWYRGTKLLTNGGRYSISENGRSSELRITKVTDDDSYTYSCEIRNLYGATYSSAWLKVLNFKPTFEKYPLENMEGMMSQEITYKCQAEGAPEPEKKWFKNNSPISVQPVTIDASTGKIKCDVKYCIYKNGNLKITSLDVSDQGNYSCSATNALGTARSSGYLTVVPEPRWTLEPENREIRLNTTVDIPCLAESEAHLDINYAWYFESVLLKFDRLDLDARRYDAAQLLRPYGRNFGSLRIENVQFENEGRYDCRLSTPIGTLSKYAWIRVTGPPGPCAGVVASTIGMSQEVHVKWVKGTAHHRVILRYIIEATRYGDLTGWKNYTTVPEVVPTPKSDFREGKFTGLAANTAYIVRVVAVNAFGRGQPSPASESFTTAPAVPFKKPENVTGGGGKMTTLVVRWNAIPEAYYNGEKFMYIVGYKDPLNRKFVDAKVDPKLAKKLNRGKQLEYTFTLPEGAKDYQPYDVRVGSENERGLGPYSDMKRVYSAERVPTSTPKDVVAAAFNSTAMVVRWIRPTPNPGEGPIVGYRIIYWPKENKQSTSCSASSYDKVRLGIRQTIWGNVAVGRIIGLQQDTYYCIVAQVFNYAGDGPESGVTEQTTFKRAPSNFPTFVKLEPTGRPKELKVLWVGLTTKPQEESLDGYQIRLWRTGSPTDSYKDFDFGLNTVGYLEALEYDRRYDLRVYGYSRGGVGTMSSPMIQFMIQRAADCIPGRYRGVDIEYIFICDSCSRIQSSAIVLLISVLTVLFYRR